MRIALIGSRELEKNPLYFKDINMCFTVAYKLACSGITFTSGLCPLGMDGLAQKAYSRALSEGKCNESQFEVYIKDESVRLKSKLPNKHLSIVRNPNLIQKTYEICEEVLGERHWNNCGDYARGMHSRNCHQILGYNLNSPVDAVVCWTPNGEIKGGTATALKIAIKHSIPIYNLGSSDYILTLKYLKDFLIKHGIEI